MPGYKSNTKKVVSGLVKLLKGVEAKVIDKTLREVAADLVASNISRIHNDGQSVRGTNIGKYKKGRYKEKRIENGRRVDKVDLSMTGKLSKELTFSAISKNEVGVGFLTEYGTKISEYNEERYGKKIWGATKEDETVAKSIAERRINQYLKNG